MQLIECVANISEGQNQDKLQQLAASISEGGATLLHVDSGASANRTVFTFVGSPENVCNSAFLLAERAVQLIDMRQHQGEHPCIGALDVLPLIPLMGISLQQCQVLASSLAKRFWDELKLPSYLYAANASATKPRKLNQLRAKNFSGLSKQVNFSDLKPDIGDAWHPTAGISIVGAREIMLAYNVNLDTHSLELGKRVARRLRLIRDSKLSRNGHSLNSVMFMAWRLEDRNVIQISCNIYDFREAPLEFIYNLISEIASEFSLKVTGSEVVGMLPTAALISDQQLAAEDLQNALLHKVNLLNLEQFEPFNISQRVLELALKASFKMEMPRL